MPTPQKEKESGNGVSQADYRGVGGAFEWLSETLEFTLCALSTDTYYK